MKIEAITTFRPVTITIETQDELDHLIIALNTTNEKMNTQKSSIPELKNKEIKGNVYGIMFNQIRNIRTAILSGK